MRRRTSIRWEEAGKEGTMERMFLRRYVEGAGGKRWRMAGYSRGGDSCAAWCGWWDAQL